MNIKYLLCVLGLASTICITACRPANLSELDDADSRPELVRSSVVPRVEAARVDSVSEKAIGQRGELFPRGKVFPFMGFSGIPERDVNYGFTAAGPSYNSNQQKPLKEAKNAGLSFPYMISIDMKFQAKHPAKPVDLSFDEIKSRIAKQVDSVAANKSICWWYLGPEELRHWRKNEMEYLRAATEAIRESDPLKRPIWMYEPNHRNAESLIRTAEFQDIVGKGSYTNLTGYRDQRAWIRWSMEQQVEAISALQKKDGRSRTPLVLPELCADPPDPAMDHLITQWVRHDVYLGLMSGGKGVAVWSLHPRKAVSRTWQIWYNAYAHVAIELTGPQRLGEVFLFGEQTSTVPVTVTKGPTSLKLNLGQKNEVESATTSKAEGQSSVKIYPTMAVCEYRYQDATYLFLCNSSGTNTLEFESADLPAGALVKNAFTQLSYEAPSGTLRGWIKPLEVKCFKITSRESEE